MEKIKHKIIHNQSELPFAGYQHLNIIENIIKALPMTVSKYPKLQKRYCIRKTHIIILISTKETRTIKKMEMVIKIKKEVTLTLTRQKNKRQLGRKIDHIQITM